MEFLTYLDFLFESNSPYPYRLIRSERDIDVYEFVTFLGTDYDVRMIRDKNVLFVSFSVKGRPQNIVINKGGVYQIFSTVIEIIKDQLDRYKNIDTIGYDPVASFSGDSRREKIYEIGIKRNFEVINIKTERSGNFVSKLIKIR